MSLTKLYYPYDEIVSGNLKQLNMNYFRAGACRNFKSINTEKKGWTCWSLEEVTGGRSPLITLQDIYTEQCSRRCVSSNRRRWGLDSSVYEQSPHAWHLACMPCRLPCADQCLCKLSEKSKSKFVQILSEFSTLPREIALFNPDTLWPLWASLEAQSPLQNNHGK